jgi:hypothetical protein
LTFSAVPIGERKQEEIENRVTLVSSFQRSIATAVDVRALQQMLRLLSHFLVVYFFNTYPLISVKSLSLIYLCNNPLWNNHNYRRKMGRKRDRNR